MHPAPLEPATETQAESARARVRRYHEGSKHRLDRYAPGPETLDWDGQPSPFRRFAGAARVSLPSSATSEGKLAESLALPLGAAPDE
ncbi:MAG TPA: hypothetical protein VFQ35_27730, partial [Polyangiaceae bacterium]|nr:hypothetical protein [Polyangiaceae bacterium]